MKKFTKEMIEELATLHMFSLNDQEIEKCISASEVFLRQIEQLYLIDTDAVEMMDMPFEEVSDWLREDVVSHTMDRQDLLDNAPLTENEFIEIVKVLD